jgi:hypothetical protein
MATAAMQYWRLTIAPDPMRISGSGQAAQLNLSQGSEARLAQVSA